MMHLIIICQLLFLIQSTTKRKRVVDLYESLSITYPGEIYSGYLDTGIEGNEHFYILTPSLDGSTNKLHIAIHGGPGCSILENYFTESGPVIIDSSSNQFKSNKYNWNDDISILYIESPSGVGFTKSKDLDQIFNDDMTAKAHLHSILEFLKEFPEYKTSEVFIGGESYGGIYVPFLVRELYSREHELNINLKGIFIGSGSTHSELDVQRSMVDYGVTHGIISLELKEEYDIKCPQLPYTYAQAHANGRIPRNVTRVCNAVRLEIRNCFEGIDIYDIYQECPYTPLSKIDNSITIQPKPIDYLQSNYLDDLLEKEVTLWPQFCGLDSALIDFVNSDKVRAKLGVESKRKWEYCNWHLLELYVVSQSFDIYRDILLKRKDLRIWFYSGDADACVSTIGTKRWIDLLNLKITKEYTQLKYHDKVAGYYQIYEDKFTFIALKGAGHLPAATKRPEMQLLFKSFIKGSIMSD